MLIEDVLLEFKRTHLEHIEDIIITDGYNGGKAVIEYFRGLLITLQGTSSEAISVSVKWDGAPAVVCGTHPETGRFFVGTKSVFNPGTPKINYTKQQIAKNHGTDDLGQKLLKCLVHLRKLNIQGVVQGDLLFTDDDIVRKNLNGTPHLTFKPNTITYAVPENSDIGKQVDTAKVGIIFHTTYNGEIFADMTASAGADTETFTQSSDVFFDNATYKDVSGSAKFTADETKQFMNGIDKLEALLNNVPRDLSNLLGTNQDFVPYFQMYINAMVKQGQLPTNVNQFLQGFQKFYAERMQQQIAGLKAQKALQLRQNKLKQMPTFMARIKKPLQAMLTFYKSVQLLKGFVLKKMNQAMAIGSFAQTDSGLEVTDPEGFVAVDKTGNAVKLVDRLGFSRRNLSIVKKFQKESMMRIDELVEGPYDPYRHKAIFFAGSPGSGKTYVARKLAGSFQGLKQVNMDSIFKHLMTKKNLSWKMPPEEEPEREKQRQRSKELVAKQQQTYADSGLGLLIDSTGRITQTVRRIKDELEDKGYETTMVFVTTDLETALRRNKERERTLPDKLIHQNFEVIEQRLGEYQRMFNDVLVIDNSESTQMSMPAQLVHVEKNIRKFLQ